VKRNDGSLLEDRLRAAFASWPQGAAEGVDMSREAIAQRLQDSFEMSRLAIELAHIGPELSRGR
jgi:hypothetical protein